MKRTDKTQEYVINLSRVLSLATADHRAKGKAWYMAARVEAWHISQRTGRPLMTVCGVIAALSPRNKWARNLFDAEQLIKNSEHRCATFVANSNKARSILALAVPTREAIAEILNGKKVSAFFDNIYDPSSTRVTVDVHMQLAAIGRYLPENERPGLTNKMYREIEDAIKKIAIDNGMAPYEVQATAWLTWKEAASVQASEARVS